MIRVAFLTPEFVTENQAGGGLGNYINRMTRVLTECGHACEVFVLSEAGGGTFDYHGVLVHQVPRKGRMAAFGAAWRMRGVGGMKAFRGATLEVIGGALALAEAVETRERTEPFGLIHSADFEAAGLFVVQRGGRPHVVRCSAAWDLWAQCDGCWDSAARIQAELEREAMRRADGVYAPSALVAEHFRRVHGIEVGVVRPPVHMEVEAAESFSQPLPERFFIHFGQLRRRKGTMMLAAALPRVWASEPGFRMVWAGSGKRRELRAMREAWGRRAGQVQMLGPVSKPEMMAVLRRAEAAVLPSLVDNLPNTVIESLMCGVPVIGSRGASVDELVEDGVTGELVAMEDAEALAECLIRWWRGEMAVRKGFVWDSAVAREMRPARAVEALLRFAGLDGGGVVSD